MYILVNPPAVIGMMMTSTMIPASVARPSSCHRRTMPMTTVIGMAHISWISRKASWIFLASTDMRLTISPTVVVCLAALDKRSDCNNLELNTYTRLHVHTHNVCVPVCVRERQRDRDRQRQTERHRETETERQRQRNRERERERERQRESAACSCKFHNL